MINSINSGSTDWYSRKRNYMVDEIVSAATASVTQTTASDTSSSEETDASAILATSRTNMSLDDSMKRMQGAKMPPPPPPEEDTSDTNDTESTETGLLSDIDTDGDGTLSTDEYEALVSQMGLTNAMSAEDFFAKVDTDEDGEITKEEMDAASKIDGKAQKTSETQTLPSDIDTDGDGSLSVDEYEALMEDLGLNNAMTSDEFFEQYDSDEDGEVTNSELESYASQALRSYQNTFQYMFDEEESILNSRA